MPKLIGSRRGRHLLPLWVQWPVFVASLALGAFAVLAWWRGDADSYPHEHLRVALLSVGVVLMAAAGLARGRRWLHVTLFLGGAAVLVAGTLVSLRLAP